MSYELLQYFAWKHRVAFPLLLGQKKKWAQDGVYVPSSIHYIVKDPVTCVHLSHTKHQFFIMNSKSVSKSRIFCTLVLIVLRIHFSM
jgi:hypothetical protein